MRDPKKIGAVTGDTCGTLYGFAKILSEAAPDVFGTEDNVLDMFKEADDEFSIDHAIRSTATCTQVVGSPCWAVKHQLDWNYFLNRRGVEIVQIHRGTIHFRTVDMDPDDFQSSQDVMFLGMYLWLLRQHRCITGVVLSVEVLAPRHQSVFCSLLKLTPSVQKVEIRGCDPLKGLSVIVPEHPILDPLGCLTSLTELGLAAMHLSNTSGALLVQAVEKNVSLKFLILIDVQMEATTFCELIGNVVTHRKLQDFRLKMAVNEPVSAYTEALSRLGKSGIKRLHLHLDCDMLPIIQGLAESVTLCDLTLESPIVSPEVLGALADILEKCHSVIRLRMCVDFREFVQLDSAADDMRTIVGRNSLQYLVLSGSNFVPEAVKAIADGLALSRNLMELHLNDCKLSCVDAFPFLRSVKECPRLTELNLGSLEGGDHLQVDFMQKLMDLNVSLKVTCVYCERQIALLQEAVETSCAFSKISVSYVQCATAEPLIRAVRATLRTLTSFSIDTPQVLSAIGGQFVAQMVRKGDVLKVLRLRCRTTPSSSIQIIKGLADSKSVAVLTIERWDMSESVQRKFIDMLRQNRSIHRLEFYLRDMNEYARFRNALLKGLSFSSSVSVVKLYLGPDRREVFDHAILPHLHRNEMLVNWAIDDILKEGLIYEGAIALERLKYSDATLDLLTRDADFSPRTAINSMQASRMATRSASCALREEFMSHNDFTPTPEGRDDFDVLLDEVMEEMAEALQVKKKDRKNFSS